MYYREEELIFYCAALVLLLLTARTSLAMPQDVNLENNAQRTIFIAHHIIGSPVVTIVVFGLFIWGFFAFPWWIPIVAVPGAIVGSAILGVLVPFNAVVGFLSFALAMFCCVGILTNTLA